MSVTDFWLKPGDRVAHVKDSDSTGVVVEIDLACYPIHEYGVTTAVVRWDDCDYEREWVDVGNSFELGTDGDVQWTNKLVKLE